MDIVDILVAKALTPQGQIETYAATAQAAVTKANQAVNNINTITQQTNTNNQLAAEAVENANAAIAALNAAIESMEDSGSMDVAAVDSEIKKLILSTSNSTSGSAISKNLITKYPDNSTRSIANIVKYYTSTGNNEDGTMTQKAITAALAAIPSGGSSGGNEGSTIHLDPEDAGQLTIVDDQGNIISSGIMGDDLASFLIKNDLAFVNGTVGLRIDYTNKTFTRTQDAIHYDDDNYSFDQYNMYGGRMRCNVNDNGAITAFYGDNNYTEDGSNGQVMIYQPKFYYSRITLATSGTGTAEKITKEVITISPDYKPGFKLHPLFIGENGETLDYILLSAFEGSGYDVSENTYDTEDSDTIDFNEDKLSSIGGVKPISGINKSFNITNAETMAQNRGEGWHITNIAAESAIQMLELTEFGTLNGQAALESGITNITKVNGANCASNTGSTVGNDTGYAAATISVINGNSTTYTNAGRRAISYRGMENPWGNIWRFVRDVKIIGDGKSQGGKVYINNESSNLQLPSSSGYISYFNNTSTQYNWLFIPAEASGNSAVPIGDQVWITNGLNNTNSMVMGGRFDSGDQAGPFAYSCDGNIDISSYGIGARLMFVPIKNTIYNNNITKWKNVMGVS